MMLAAALKSIKQNRGRVSQATSKIVFAPNTYIPYRSNLIAELKENNRNILARIKMLLIKIQNKDFERSHQVLLEIKRSILSQFMREYTSLFVYIKAMNKNNPLQSRLIKELKREMGGVQSMLFLFFNTYLDIKLTKKNLYAMGRELYVIGTVLCWRFKRQEKVTYPMYTAP